MVSKILSITLIVGSLIFAGLIVFQKNSNKEILGEPAAFKIQNLESATTPTPLGQGSDRNVKVINSTEKIASKLSQEILSRNANGPELIGEKPWLSVADPEAVLDQLIDETLANFDYQSFKPIVRDSEIIISPQNDKNSVNAYLAFFQNVLSSNVPRFKKDEGFVAENLKSLLTAYEKTVTELKKLAVPSSLKELHKEEIALLTAQKTVFEIILNYQQDPFQTVLALRANDDLNKELAVLKQKFQALNN